MKITKSQLKQIIKEEIEAFINESELDEAVENEDDAMRLREANSEE